MSDLFDSAFLILHSVQSPRSFRTPHMKGAGGDQFSCGLIKANGGDITIAEFCYFHLACFVYDFDLEGRNVTQLFVQSSG